MEAVVFPKLKTSFPMCRFDQDCSQGASLFYLVKHHRPFILMVIKVFLILNLKIITTVSCSLYLFYNTEQSTHLYACDLFTSYQ